jgi:hypothetical protein
MRMQILITIGSVFWVVMQELMLYCGGVDVSVVVGVPAYLPPFLILLCIR